MRCAQCFACYALRRCQGRRQPHLCVTCPPFLKFCKQYTATNQYYLSRCRTWPAGRPRCCAPGASAHLAHLPTNRRRPLPLPRCSQAESAAAPRLAATVGYLTRSQVSRTRASLCALRRRLAAALASCSLPSRAHHGQHLAWCGSATTTCQSRSPPPCLPPHPTAAHRDPYHAAPCSHTPYHASRCGAWQCRGVSCMDTNSHAILHRPFGGGDVADGI